MIEIKWFIFNETRCIFSELMCVRVCVCDMDSTMVVTRVTTTTGATQATHLLHLTCHTWVQDTEDSTLDMGKSLFLNLSDYQLMTWHSGRTSVFGRRTYPVSCSTFS